MVEFTGGTIFTLVIVHLAHGSSIFLSVGAQNLFFREGSILNGIKIFDPWPMGLAHGFFVFKVGVSIENGSYN